MAYSTRPYLAPGSFLLAGFLGASLSTASELPAEPPVEGARIGEIHIHARDVFDINGDDTDTWYARLGNRLHTQTRDATIEDQLLFHSGDPFSASQLDESARILRRSRYLRDAVVRPVAVHDGLVDIDVTTQDVWSFNPGVSFGMKGGRSTAGFELQEVNFLGTGSRVELGFESGIDRNSTYFNYFDRQLGSSWWSLGAGYANNSDGRLASLSLEKPFYSLGSRVAGGVTFTDDRRVEARYDLGAIVDRYQVQNRYFSAYWGSSPGLAKGWARRFTTGFTYDDNQFSGAPGYDAPRLVPADRKLVYPWVGFEWVQDSFTTVRNHDRIARTEDILLGWRMRARLGFASSALGSDRNALVYSAGLEKGLLSSGRQTLLMNLDLTGRAERGRAAGSEVSANAHYYLQQSPQRLLFLGLSATAGSHLDADQQIRLGGDNGLRGYPLRYQAGQGHWLFTAEQRFFTNWYPFELFNIGAAVFYDMGASWGRDPLGTSSRGLLRDVGLGLRIGNNRSSRGSVVHVDLAMPLDGGPRVHGPQINIQTKTTF